ncbi:6653_t:CDS:2, partial [Acaulospora colombiana]
KRKWEDERAQKDRDFKIIETSSVSREEIVRKDSEISLLRATLERERKAREDDKIAWQDEKLEDMARLQQEMEDARGDGSKGADAELDMVADQLQAIIKAHNITLSPSQRRDMSISSLTTAISDHLDLSKGGSTEWESARRALERDLKASLDRRDKLSQEVEDARKEREAARKEIRSLEERIRELELSERPYPMKSNSLNSDPGSSNGSRNSEDMDRVMSVLRTLWSLLPSREARAARSIARSGSPSSPLRTTGARFGEPPSPSLADLDVRALKALYDPRNNNASSPLFNSSNNPADFTIDAFAQKVQALVADDRAIIERLLRFAQSHDLLKNNAERAQKLAQESSLGLETYQKQIKLLEDRNASIMTKQTDLLDEINALQTNMERAQREKRQLEMKATEQAINLQNLTDANSALSARALALAEEVSTAPETIRIKLEAQLSETRRQLKESMDELDAIRSSEQSQKAALLEELNVVQGENSKLRDQLRAEQRKNGGR